MMKQAVTVIRKLQSFSSQLLNVPETILKFKYSILNPLFVFVDHTYSVGYQLRIEKSN